MNAMAKFLVPLTVFLLSPSLVAGNQVRINHLTQLQQQMSNPMSETSCEYTCKPTNDQMVNDQTTNQRLERGAELPNILSPKPVNRVNHDHDNIKVDKGVAFSDERDSDILSKSPVECNS